MGQFLCLSFPVLEMETVVTATSVALQARACADSLMPAEYKISTLWQQRVAGDCLEFLQVGTARWGRLGLGGVSYWGTRTCMGEAGLAGVQELRQCTIFSSLPLLVASCLLPCPWLWQGSGLGPAPAQESVLVVLQPCCLPAAPKRLAHL